MGDTSATAAVPGTVLTVVGRGLRILAVIATLSATLVMVTSHQSRDVSYILPDYSTKTVTLDYNYKHLMCFKAFVGVNIAATLYGMFAASLPVNSMLWRLIVVLDVIMCVLLASIDSIAMAVAYLHKNGDSQAFWNPICSQVSKYCELVMIAIIVGFTGVGLYLAIAIYSISLILNPLLV